MSTGRHRTAGCALTQPEHRIYELLLGLSPAEPSSAAALAEHAGCSPSTARRHLKSMRLKRHASRRPDGGWVALTPDAHAELAACQFDVALRIHRKSERAFGAKVDRWVRRTYGPGPGRFTDQLNEREALTIEVVTTTRRVSPTSDDEVGASPTELPNNLDDSGIKEIDTLLRSLGLGV